jgi:polyferredoxin
VRIVTVRRLCQAFFLALFLWFCLVATPGTQFYRLQGWRISWLLELDPLVALGNLLSTGTLSGALPWACLVVAGTLVFGRFFCGWVCPLGTLQHLLGWWSARKRPFAARIDANRPRSAQGLRVASLLVHLAAASGTLLAFLMARSFENPAWLALPLLLALGAARLRARGGASAWRTFLLLLGAFFAAWLLLAATPGIRDLFVSSLQLGLLDPIPLLHRSINLLILPWLDRAVGFVHTTPRVYALSGLGFLVLAATLGASAIQPRAFCRYACPLGGLLGVLGRKALFRVAKREASCSRCGHCDAVCEGACAPSGQLRASSCVLCMNCVDACPDGVLGYGLRPSEGGVDEGVGLGRRATLASLATGLVTVPMMRLGGQTSTRWNPELVRPPGALPEESFLARCVACGQCMRVCPSNVLQPAGLTGGFETLWTPRLDNRAGTSGCLPHCTACGEVCPTGALRRLDLDEKLGHGRFLEAGPIRLGTAHIDPGRCLPWASSRTCLVCQEVCPVSPKAIRMEARPSGVDGTPIALPFVVPDACTGCGICEHECPVVGLRAIRVTAEGESRAPDHQVLLNPRSTP